MSQVRPCGWYWEEYKECSRFLGRVHQYFIFGHKLDCSEWNEDYQRCMKFRKTKDKKLFVRTYIRYLSLRLFLFQISSNNNQDELVANEESRINQRLAKSEANDVWNYRKEPPKDWNKPLNDHQTNAPSPLYMYEQERQKKETI